MNRMNRMDWGFAIGYLLTGIGMVTAAIWGLVALISSEWEHAGISFIVYLISRHLDRQLKIWDIERRLRGL